MSDPKIWYAVIDGKADGPHTEETIRSWLDSGKLNYSDLAFRPGLSKWVNIAELSEFERRVPEKAAPAAPKLKVPQAAEEGKDGWIALVKHDEVDGQHHYVQSGPYTTAQIKDKVKRGEISSTDHVWKQGFASWTVISTLPEFERRNNEPALKVEPKPEIKSEKKSETKPEMSRPELSKPEMSKPVIEFESIFSTSEEKSSVEKPQAPLDFNHVKPPENDSAPKTSGMPKPAISVKPEAQEESGFMNKPSSYLKSAWQALKPESGKNEEKQPEPKETKETKETKEAKWDKSVAGGTNPGTFPGFLMNAETPNEQPAKEAPKTEKPKAGIPRPMSAKDAARTEREEITKPTVITTSQFHKKPDLTHSEVIKPIPAAPQAAPKTAPKMEAPPPPPEVDPEVKEIEEFEDHLDSLDSSAPVRSHFRKKVVLSGVVASFVMALLYAGFMAYKDSLKGGDFFRRFSLRRSGQVAGVQQQRPNIPAVGNRPGSRVPTSVNPQAPAPTNQAPAGQAKPAQPAKPGGALPDPFSENKPQVPVNPENENPAKPPATLEIVSLKPASDHPQLAFQTDIPGGNQINVEITARSGAILRYPSFKLMKTVPVVAGAMPSLDLTSDHLPSGDYIVTAKGSGLAKTVPLSVGVHDDTFKKALVEYKKKVARQQKEERAKLKEGVTFVSRSFASISKSYRYAKNPLNSDAKSRWNKVIKAWKKEFESRAKDVKSLSERSRNQWAYPEQMIELKNTERKLLEVYRSYDRSLKAGREIASDDPAEAEFKESLRALKNTAAKLR